MSAEEVAADVAEEVIQEDSIEESEAAEEIIDGEEAIESDEADISDEVEDAAEAIEEAIEDGASEEEVREMIETFKLKVNGKEKEVTLDWNNKEDIVRRLQMAEASQEAMKKSAELEKTFDREIDRLAKNPWEVLQEMGMDPDALAEERIQQTIEQLQKSPEQIAREERDAELEDLRTRLREQEDAKEAAEMERLQLEATADLKQSIEKALSATTKLPNSEYVMRRVADTMVSLMDSGYDNITADDVVPIVEKEINEDFSKLLDSLPDDAIESYLGKRTVERMRKQRLKKMPKTSKTKDIGKTTEAKSTSEKISMKDFLK